MKKIKYAIYITGILIISSILLNAHDTWLVPDPWVIQPGTSVRISVRTGMDFPFSLNAVALDRIGKFYILGKGGRVKLGNHRVEGKSTTATCIPGKPGTHVAALALKPRKIELTAKAFNDYLLHDGMKKVWEYRKREGILEEDAVEYYAKYPKTLIQVGDVTDDTCVKPAGLKAEIVPLVNPYTLKKGDKMKVRVLFMGRPLAGTEVAWSYPGMGETFAGSVISGEYGEAVVPLEKAGPYVIRMTHMEHVKKPDHQWESSWASLTFSVRE